MDLEEFLEPINTRRRGFDEKQGLGGMGDLPFPPIPGVDPRNDVHAGGELLAEDTFSQTAGLDTTGGGGQDNVGGRAGGRDQIFRVCEARPENRFLLPSQPHALPGRASPHS